MFPPDRSARCVREGSSNGALAAHEGRTSLGLVANSAEQHEATGFRLSPEQELLLLSDPGISSQCAVSIDLDPERVRDALSELGSRYEILRTVFVRSAGMRLTGQWN